MPRQQLLKTIKIIINLKLRTVNYSRTKTFSKKVFLHPKRNQNALPPVYNISFPCTYRRDTVIVIQKTLTPNDFPPETIEKYSNEMGKINILLKLILK